MTSFVAEVEASTSLTVDCDCLVGMLMTAVGMLMTAVGIHALPSKLPAPE